MGSVAALLTGWLVCPNVTLLSCTKPRCKCHFS
uniref:Uncharacterized protein n=1 Tax=Anguilla anguilla TaxID=7936 RepID=A0A0E9VUI1_ANGAN